jgi:hypothetical protein
VVCILVGEVEKWFLKPSFRLCGVELVGCGQGLTVNGARGAGLIVPTWPYDCLRIKGWGRK